MLRVMINRSVSLIFAVATNLVLAAFFFRALTHPVDFKDFIYGTGLMIYMIEFMSLHSSGMFFGAAAQEQKSGTQAFPPKVKVALFLFYSLMILGIAAGTKQWLAAAFFIVSLAGKAIYSKSIDAERRMAPVAAGVATLLICTFVVVFSASALASWFPLPSEVRAARPAGQSGLFIGKPQTLMAWGVMYFGLMSVWEILIFRRAVKGPSAQRSDTGYRVANSSNRSASSARPVSR